MSLNPARLTQVLDRFEQVEARLGAASGGTEIVALSKEHAELRPVAEAVRDLRRAESDVRELGQMIAELPPGDEMAGMAKVELAELEAKLPELERKVQLMLLPREQRAPFELYVATGLDYRGIASELGLPIGTVRSRLHRARAALQALLHDDAPEPSPSTATAGGDAVSPHAPPTPTT
jgi:DNA-directed RNA polymerase specialized sigma24 family protein